MSDNDVISIYVTSPNGATDPNPGNNSTISFNVDMAIQNTHTDITVQIVTDAYGSETTWEITNINGVVVLSGGPYNNLSSGGTTTHPPITTTLAANTCHTFTIYDSYGDGMNAGYGAGSFTVTDANGLVLSSGGQFSDQDEDSFKTGDNSGCMDPIACNYAATATLDDGTCEYVSNPTVDLIVGDWTWEIDVNCSGNLLNYPIEFYSDGTGLFNLSDSVTWSMCNDILTIENNNLNITTYVFYDQGGIISGANSTSCFTIYCSSCGCMDPNACNYDASAIYDDGNCGYPSTSSTIINACDSYNWNGVSYTTSGIYTYNTTNVFGCDSIATLDLIINYTSSSSTMITSCDSYNWNGIDYTTSGIYYYITTGGNGCDSTATLDLTINYTSNSSTMITS